MRGRGVFLIVVLSMIIGCSDQQPAHAMIVINEILADPATGLAGDANHDGVSSSTQDEFVELLNNSVSPVNISGWSIHDAISSRHIFPANTILSAYQYLVIFGGGSPNLSGVNWQVASTGQLSLNNTAETVTLLDASNNIVDQVVYGSIGNHDQSIVHFPEGNLASSFVLHSTLPQSSGTAFSPGTSISGGQFNSSTTVPEWPTAIYFGFSLAAILFRYRQKCEI